MKYTVLVAVICLLISEIIAVIDANEAKGENQKVMDEKEKAKFKVKKVDEKERAKTYGGKKIANPPKKLKVTDEVWFKFQIKDYHGVNKPYVGKVTIGCFGEITPVTCLNFVSLAKGYRKGRGIMSYKGTKVQKIIRDFMIQMGDVETKFTKGESIFGSSFNDESFAISHSNAGWVGMANFGPDSNGSQFYILLRSARWLDGRHVVFAKVLEGMDILQLIADEETNNTNLPYRVVSIKDCGVNNLKQPYILTDQQFNTDKDIPKEKSA